MNQHDSELDPESVRAAADCVNGDCAMFLICSRLVPGGQKRLERALKTEPRAMEIISAKVVTASRDFVSLETYQQALGILEETSCKPCTVDELKQVRRDALESN